VTPAVFGFAIAYDPAEPGVVLFGGRSLTAVSTSTWLWTPPAVNGSPLKAGTVSIPYGAPFLGSPLRLG